MRPLTALAFLAGLASIAATTVACSDDDGGGGVTADVAIVDGASSLGDLAFDPNPFTESFANSAEVVWVNDDGVTHRLVSDVAGIFDSGNMSAGDDFTHTFAAAGTYPYHCSIHPTMVGSIVIMP
jgi:plastocyanin